MMSGFQNQNMLRCRHSHIYKLCQLLRHGNSVKLRSLKMCEKLLPHLTNGLESDLKVDFCSKCWSLDCGRWHVIRCGHTLFRLQKGLTAYICMSSYNKNRELSVLPSTTSASSIVYVSETHSHKPLSSVFDCHWGGELLVIFTYII